MSARKSTDGLRALSVESKGYGLQHIQGFSREVLGRFSHSQGYQGFRGGVLCGKGFTSTSWTDILFSFGIAFFQDLQALLERSVLITYTPYGYLLVFCAVLLARHCHPYQPTTWNGHDQRRQFRQINSYPNLKPQRLCME